MAKNNETVDRIQSVWNKLGGEEGINKLLSGEWIVGEPAKIIKGRQLESSASKNTTIIHVDRQALPTYSEWMKELVRPLEERMGPKSFDVAKLDHYLFGKQKTNGYETGHAIQKHLEDEDLLKTCLNLQDLIAIQAKGIDFFRAHFKGKAVFAWKSVVRNRDGDLYAPCLIEFDGRVGLGWRWLDDLCHENDPALRFAD